MLLSAARMNALMTLCRRLGSAFAISALIEATMSSPLSENPAGIEPPDEPDDSAILQATDAGSYFHFL
jgi:hypothetical protein